MESNRYVCLKDVELLDVYEMRTIKYQIGDFVEIEDSEYSVFSSKGQNYYKAYLINDDKKSTLVNTNWVIEEYFQKL